MAQVHQPNRGDCIFCDTVDPEVLDPDLFDAETPRYDVTINLKWNVHQKGQEVGYLLLGTAHRTFGRGYNETEFKRVFAEALFRRYLAK